MRVNDPTLSMVANRRECLDEVKRPSNSSIGLRISEVIVMFWISGMSDIHFHPFVADSHTISLFSFSAGCGRLFGFWSHA